MSENIDDNEYIVERKGINTRHSDMLLKKKWFWYNISKIEDSKKESLRIISQCKEYQQIYTLRQQIGFMTRKSAEIAHEKNNAKYKLSQSDLAQILNLNTTQIKNHMREFKVDENDERKEIGRPFCLNKNERTEVFRWLEALLVPPKLCEVKEYIFTRFKKLLSNESLRTLMGKIGYECRKATPMEEKRYFVDSNKVHYYYTILRGFTQANMIPSALCYNLDEEGHDDYQDSSSSKIVVTQNSAKDLYFPVKRNGKRSTFLACIDGSGGYVKPLIITKRKTFDISIIEKGVTPDNVMLGYSQTGYITTALFNEWLDNCFLPFVKNKRQQLNYDGIGIILLDGFAAHITDHFFQVCDELNLQIFFLPSHSSHITQPLDLGIFGNHKGCIRGAWSNFDDDESQFVTSLIKILDGWQKAATTHNIMSAWKQAGAVYILGGVSYTFIHFDSRKARVYQEYLSAEQKALEETMLAQTEIARKLVLNQKKKETAVGKSRLSVLEFNKQALKDKIALLKPVDNSKDEKLNKTNILLLCLVKIDNAEKTLSCNLDVNQKGRTKKINGSEYNDDYAKLDYETKLGLELASLGI